MQRELLAGNCLQVDETPVIRLLQHVVGIVHAAQGRPMNAYNALCEAVNCCANSGVGPLVYGIFCSIHHTDPKGIQPESAGYDEQT